jgi:hypothetical protein
MSRHAAVRWIDVAAHALIAATAVAAVCVALAGTGLRAQGEASASRLRAAMAAYEARRWPQAYAQLAAAADAGDPAAARVAAMMARHGPLLFGQRFDAGADRLRRWDEAMRGVDAAPAVAAAPAIRLARAR